MLDNYDKINIIGRGSYGEVWLVKHKRDRRQYVLKKIDLHNASKREQQAAQQEGKLLSKFKHPNIVSYKESFQHTDGFLYIIMGYCEGGDVYSKLKEQKNIPLDERQVVEWFVQIAMALQYMHDRNILHRDLKTQNIFLTKTKIIKVGDLGIARILDTNTDMATTLIGTPYYMSPELFSNKPYNHKSDVWALGCCVYEMATLKHAFNARDMSALVCKIIRGHMPAMPKQYSAELISLIKAMLDPNPDNRPSVSKILRDPYIKKHIALFLEDTRKNQRPSSTNVRPNPRLPPAPSEIRRNSPGEIIPQNQPNIVTPIPPVSHNNNKHPSDSSPKHPSDSSPKHPSDSPSKHPPDSPSKQTITAGDTQKTVKFKNTDELVAEIEIPQLDSHHSSGGSDSEVNSGSPKAVVTDVHSEHVFFKKDPSHSPVKESQSPLKVYDPDNYTGNSPRDPLEGYNIENNNNNNYQHNIQGAPKCPERRKDVKYNSMLCDGAVNSDHVISPPERQEPMRVARPLPQPPISADITPMPRVRAKVHRRSASSSSSQDKSESSVTNLPRHISDTSITPSNRPRSNSQSSNQSDPPLYNNGLPEQSKPPRSGSVSSGSVSSVSQYTDVSVSVTESVDKQCNESARKRRRAKKQKEEPYIQIISHPVIVPVKRRDSRTDRSEQIVDSLDLASGDNKMMSIQRSTSNPLINPVSILKVRKSSEGDDIRPPVQPSLSSSSDTTDGRHSSDDDQIISTPDSNINIIEDETYFKNAVGTEEKELNKFINLLDTTLNFESKTMMDDEADFLLPPPSTTHRDNDMFPGPAWNTLGATKTLAKSRTKNERADAVRMDLENVLGEIVIKEAIMIADMFQEEEMERKLVDLLGQELFDKYISRIFQLMILEERAY